MPDLSFFACPRCREPIEPPATCACGGSILMVEGWCFDACDDALLSTVHHDRVDAFSKPLTARLYDLDVRLTSALVWGAPLARQVEFNARALEVAADAGEPFVDVPVGGGLVLAKALRRSTRTPSAVVVVDLSMPMLRRARERLGDGAIYVRASAEMLPFRSRSIAAVHSANGLHLYPAVDAACDEMARVVAQGGSVFASTWANDGRWAARAYQRLLRRLRYINEPRSADTYSASLERAGLVGSSERLGTLLLWSGLRTGT